jgi:hypothetical protein
LVNENNKLEVDFIIGRLENINQDFRFIADKLNIKTTIKIMNSSTADQSSIHLFTSKMKEKVQEIYAQYFELFDYSK